VVLPVPGCPSIRWTRFAAYPPSKMPRGAYLGAVKARYPPHRRYRLLNGVNDAAGHALFHDLRHRSAPERNHGGAARHGFDHHQAGPARIITRPITSSAPARTSTRSRWRWQGSRPTT
jgi:hypothetical protein